MEKSRNESEKDRMFSGIEVNYNDDMYQDKKVKTD